MFLINPYIYSVGTSYLLDTYGSAVVAYSLRKVESTYSGNLIRVRRSSDNAEQDIGLSGDSLDTSALTTFVGANDGFVVSWYDQSGNGRTISQVTATNQPKIVSSGSVVLASNGLPALLSDGNDAMLNTGFTSPTFDFTICTTFEVPNLTTSYALYSTDTNLNQIWISRAGGSNRIYCTQGEITATKLSVGGHLSIVTAKSFGNNRMSAWEDGSNITTNQYANTSTANNGIYLLSRSSYSGICPSGTYIQEFIQFNSDLTSQVADINTDINSHYSIY